MTVPVRVIPCLDIDRGRVVKGVQFLALKDAGDPVEIAKGYAEEGADEIVFLDISATYEGRDLIYSLVEKVAREVFLPMTVGGGIRTLKDVERALRAGADKVSINTRAVEDPRFVEESARTFGSQCIVVAVDVRKRKKGRKIFWEVVTHGGRNPTGLSALEWVQRVESLGAGEILLTSMDQDGTRQGYDIPLLQEVTSRVKIPVIASGGAGSPEDMVVAVEKGGAKAVLAASIFHFGFYRIREIKGYMELRKIPVRPIPAILPKGVSDLFSGSEDLLYPVIVQDRWSGEVLMSAWVNKTALLRSYSTGIAHFYSRSRKALWKKGETSGNYLLLYDIYLDCDTDTFLYLVTPLGPACHTGERSCFHRSFSGKKGFPLPYSHILPELSRIVEDRVSARRGREKSYTYFLFSHPGKAFGKVREESEELLQALQKESPERISEEGADLLYHLLVALRIRKVSLYDLLKVLYRRLGISGFQEKKSRKKRNSSSF
jgi:imidazoleglycerol phosphate synthase cyclase subunit/phosphoribosyl-ATP pyrophosphohydrolase